MRSISVNASNNMPSTGERGRYIKGGIKMLQPFNKAVMTNAGAELLTRAQAGEAAIQFTRVVTGDGVYGAEEKELSVLQRMTELKSQKNSYPISKVSIYSEYSVKITAYITNQDPVTGTILVNTGYHINEIGLYAKEKDGDSSTEILYSITTISGDKGDFMPPYNGYNPAQIIQDYIVTVNNTADVTIQTGVGAVALAEDLEALKESLKNISVNVMEGATSEADGKEGLVPAPGITDIEKFLRADGIWAEISLNDLVICEGAIPSSKFDSFKSTGTSAYVRKTLQLKVRKYYSGEEISVRESSETETPRVILLGYMMGRLVDAGNGYNINYYHSALTDFSGLASRGVEVTFRPNKLTFIYKSSISGNPLTEWLQQYNNGNLPEGLYIAAIGLLCDANKNPLNISYDRVKNILMTSNWT